MSRAVILRDGLSIPASDDFVAAFGCDVEFDDQTYTELYSFVDELNQTSKMWLGTVDGTFSLLIAREGAEILRVYDETLSCVKLDEKRQLIIVALGKGRGAQRLDFCVWPRISAVFTRTKSGF